MDDLYIVMKDPKSFVAVLEGPEHKFTLQGTGPLNFHLGCGFVRDSLMHECWKICEENGRVLQANLQVQSSPLQCTFTTHERRSPRVRYVSIPQ